MLLDQRCYNPKGPEFVFDRVGTHGAYLNRACSGTILSQLLNHSPIRENRPTVGVDDIPKHCDDYPGGDKGPACTGCHGDRATTWVRLDPNEWNVCGNIMEMLGEYHVDNEWS